MDDIIAVISRIREHANRLIISELEKNGIVGVVPSHGDILAVLSRCEYCTMKELAEQIRRSKPTVTVLVNKLEQLGLLCKEYSITDARVCRVMLTPSCRELMPAIKGISERLLQTVYRNFTDSQSRTVYKYLKQIEQNFEEN